MKLISGQNKILNVAATEYFDAQMACWFTMPRAVEVNGRTFTGGVQSVTVPDGSWNDPWMGLLDPTHEGGNVVAIEIGVPKRHLLYKSYSDDHNNPSFLLADNKPPVVFVTQHNADSHVICRVGTTPLDLSTLGEPQNIDFSSVGGKVSYSQTWASGDTVICICRTGNSAQFWSASISSDYCETWGAAVQIINFTDQGYIVSNQDGDTIHCMGSIHPARSFGQSIWYFSINLASGDIAHRDGTVIANLDGTNLPLATSSLDVVHSITDADIRTWPKDMGADGSMIWAQWNESTDINGGDYLHGRWESSEWKVSTIASTGGRWGNTNLTYGDQQTYRGGGCIDASGDAWLSRKENGTWMIQRWTRSGENWSLAETVASSKSRRLVRPYCPIGRSTGPRVVWNEVQEYTTPGMYKAGVSWEGKDS